MACVVYVYVAVYCSGPSPPPAAAPAGAPEEPSLPAFFTPDTMSSIRNNKIAV